MKKKILLLGAGKNQALLYKHIIEKNDVTVVSENKDSKIPVDILCSITDHQKLLKLIKYKPDIIMTNSFTYGQKTLSRLNTRLELPGLKDHDYEILNNKLLQKKIIKESGIKIPDDFQTLNFFNRARTGKGGDWDNNELMKEPFIKGKTLCFRYAVIDNSPVFIDMAQRFYRKHDPTSHYMEIFGIIPEYNIKTQALNIAEIINNSLSIRDLGFLKIDCIENNGTLVFIEAEYEFVPSDYIILSRIYNKDLLKTGIDIMLDKKTKISTARKKNICGGYVRNKKTKQVFFI